MKNNRYFNLFRNTAIFLFSGLIIFYLADYGFNGVIREWFYSRFYIEPYPTEEGRIGTLFLQWSEIKSFLVYSFVFFFLFIALIMMTALMLQARAQRKREISMIIRLLDAITGDEEMSSLPEGFSEVETRHMKIRNDIARQKQLAETEMQRKSDLITYLAHDLKTPLASIIGYCSILDEAKDMPDAQKEKYVRIALDKAYRLEDLINEFFEITRFNLHTLVLNLERIKLSYML